MGWILHGEPWTNNGDYSPLQVGRAAHIRFRHTGKPGRLLTVTVYPMAPEVSVERFDMDRVRVEAMTEYMICDDADDPGGTEKWCDYRHRELDTGSYTGSDEEKVRAAEADALSHVHHLKSEPGITWDGEPF